jgi:hypothetical protein
VEACVDCVDVAGRQVEPGSAAQSVHRAQLEITRKELLMTFKAVFLPSLLGASLLLAAACSKGNERSTTAQRVEATSGELRQSEALTATVQEVDRDHRVVTLRDQAGHPFSVEVSENVALDDIRPNDSVRVAYQESVAFALQEKGTSTEPSVEQTTRRIPDGVQYGRRIDTTVEIVSVSSDGSHATFRGPEGGVRSVHVTDASNQEKIANLRPGDSVAVTYTEKLDVALAPGGRE